MINRVVLIGNVGMEPEVRSLESGVKVARLRVATNEHFSTANGERREHTEWHTVVLWRSMADFAERNMHKGSQIYVEGKIRSRERIDKDSIKKTYYEIHADEVRLLGRKESAMLSQALSSINVDSSTQTSTNSYENILF